MRIVQDAHAKPTLCPDWLNICVFEREVLSPFIRAMMIPVALVLVLSAFKWLKNREWCTKKKKKSEKKAAAPEEPKKPKEPAREKDAEPKSVKFSDPPLSPVGLRKRRRCSADYENGTQRIGVLRPTTRNAAVHHEADEEQENVRPGLISRPASPVSH